MIQEVKALKSEAKKVIDERILSLTYFEDQKLVKAKWHGFIRVADVQAIEKAMLDCVERNRVTRYLSDTSKLKIISKELQQYFLEVMLKLQKAGIKRFAVLQSENAFTQTTVNNIIDKFNEVGSFELNVFVSEDQAQKWLLQKTLYKSKYGEILFDPEHNWLYVNWANAQTPESIREIGDNMVAGLKNEGVAKILNDNRMVKGSWTHSTDYIKSEWFPIIFDAGLKYFAWILSPDVFSKFATNKVLESVDESKVKTFKDINEATKWLQSV